MILTDACSRAWHDARQSNLRSLLANILLAWTKSTGMANAGTSAKKLRGNQDMLPLALRRDSTGSESDHLQMSNSIRKGPF